MEGRNEGRMVPIVVGQKIGKWELVLGFLFLTPPRIMGWCHIQSKWFFSTNEFSLEACALTIFLGDSNLIRLTNKLTVTVTNYVCVIKSQYWFWKWRFNESSWLTISSTLWLQPRKSAVHVCVARRQLKSLANQWTSFLSRFNYEWFTCNRPLNFFNCL